MESRGFTELEPMARAVALHLLTGEAAGQSETLSAVPGGAFYRGEQQHYRRELVPCALDFSAR